MMLNVYDWTGGPFLGLYAGIAVVAFLGLAGFVAMLKRGKSDSATWTSLKPVEWGLLAGGPARAADVLALSLVEDGHLAVRADGNLERTKTSDASSPMLNALRTRDGIIKRSVLEEALSPWIKPSYDRLGRLGLIPARADIHRIRQVTLYVFGAILLFGSIKFVVGLERGRPVGYLVACLVATLVVGLIYLGRSTRRVATRAGETLLRQHRASNARSLRAPMRGELLGAFAVTGAAVLLGTPLAGYAAAMRGGGGGGGCGGGSGDGGGAGCGGGGGGCGGCGS